MSYGALGLVEVVGSCNAVVVLDQMLKTSDVEFRTWHTKCGGHALSLIHISAPSEETSRLVKEEEEKHHK